MMSTVTTTRNDRTAEALVVELGTRLRDVATAEIRAQVRAALEDLSGSVSPESLSEMALRLAHHRLTETDTFA
jgi:hypothetical protein